MNKFASIIAFGLDLQGLGAVEDGAVGRTRSHAAAATVLVLCLAAAASGCTRKQPLFAEASPSATPPATTKTAEPAVVEPGAVKALEQMSAYLQTLPAFELATDTSLDLVNEGGQRVTLGGKALYKFRRPNGFSIDLKTDYKNRRFYFDGKKITVYAPDFGYYATVAAPPTVRETLDLMSMKYGIALPLEDLFRWSDPASSRAKSLTSAFLVGTAAVDGVETDHYAFREGDKDWQIWIEKGARPLPRRVVIVDRTDPSYPTYDARLTWKANTTLASDQFVFKPAHDDKQIRLASAVN
jgi:hypothetical protein